ncbi:MAG: cohesin domain-containing protein [Saprospiraceae bacterium]|nr:cohesin domain-containing protein [Saprospiraceae bacterium]
MMKRLLSLILFFGSIPVLIHAQSLSVGTKQANLGETICLDLNTEDISNMLTAQFTIDYFSEHIEYVGVENFSLSEDPPVNSFSNHIPGYVTFSWIADDLVNGYDLEDEEVIFQVCFKVLTDDITVPIYLTASPTSVEITDKDLNILDVSLGLGLIVVGNGNMVEDPIVDIPDPLFKSDILLKGFDLNNDGELQESEAKDIFSLHSNDLAIETAEGIQYFTNLSNLKLINNQLTILDVSNNLNLKSLECQGNSIDTITLAPDLEFLNCSQNNIKSIALGVSPKLTVVVCRMNQIDYLEVSNLWQLEVLDCSVNKLDGLILGNNAQLELLVCSENNITELDLTSNPDLEYLDCSSNQLLELDIEDHLFFEVVYCQDNSIEELNLFSATGLEKLDCSRNNIDDLVFNQFPELTQLRCGNNLLSDLDFSSMTKLSILECPLNQFESLDLASNPLLSVLDCSTNALFDLDLSANIKVSFLNCADNFLNNIDVLMLDDLIEFDCSENTLASIDLVGLNELSVLNCSSNLLTDLDLSTNTGLTALDCSVNEIKELNIKNGQEHEVLDFSQNISMTAVCVDFAEQEQVLALVDSYGYLDCQVFLDCDMVATTEVLDASIRITPSIVQDALFIEYNLLIDRFYILDSSGRIVMECKDIRDDASMELDMSTFSAGIYFVNVFSSNGLYSEKIIKL